MTSHTRAPVSVRLKEIAAFNPTAPQLRAEEKVAFVPMAAVSELGTMLIGEHASVSDLKPGYSYMQSGDVLVAKITPCFENNKIAIAEVDTRHAFGSTEFHVIRADANRLNNRYLVHFSVKILLGRLAKSA